MLRKLAPKIPINYLLCLWLCSVCDTSGIDNWMQPEGGRQTTGDHYTQLPRLPACSKPSSLLKARRSKCGVGWCHWWQLSIASLKYILWLTLRMLCSKQYVIVVHEKCMLIALYIVVVQLNKKDWKKYIAWDIAFLLLVKQQTVMSSYFVLCSVVVFVCLLNLLCCSVRSVHGTYIKWTNNRFAVACD